MHISAQVPTLSTLLFRTSLFYCDVPTSFAPFTPSTFIFFAFPTFALHLYYFLFSPYFFIFYGSVGKCHAATPPLIPLWNSAHFCFSLPHPSEIGSKRTGEPHLRRLEAIGSKLDSILRPTTGAHCGGLNESPRPNHTGLIGNRSSLRVILK